MRIYSHKASSSFFFLLLLPSLDGQGAEQKWVVHKYKSSLWKMIPFLASVDTSCFYYVHSFLVCERITTRRMATGKNHNNKRE